jgi:1-acyl-sn-glycerol-3-phosphate acyltransferase
MVFFRRIYRITALIAWSFIMAVISMPYQLTGGWSRIKSVSRLVHVWNKGVARIVNLRVNTIGDIPRLKGGLVVSNHLSYVDIIAHGSVLPVRYAAKSDIAKWPVLGWYLNLSRPIWTDRESKQASRKAVRDFAKTMRRGMYLIVYPEGTTTDGKRGVLPFKSTSFEAAIAGKMPVIPVITRYAEVAGRSTVCWYGDMTLLPHVWRVLGFPSIDVTLKFLEPVLPATSRRKEFASSVHAVMSREYENTRAA